MDSRQTSDLDDIEWIECDVCLHAFSSKIHFQIVAASSAVASTASKPQNTTLHHLFFALCTSIYSFLPSKLEWGTLIVG